MKPTQAIGTISRDAALPAEYLTQSGNQPLSGPIDWQPTNAELSQREGREIRAPSSLLHPAGLSCPLW